MIETTYIMIKPGFANHKEIIEEVKARIEELNLEILDEGYIKYDIEHARRHYAEHIGKGFYQELEDYITSDKAYGIVARGENAILAFKSIAGGVKDLKEGTIRYDIPRKFGVPCDMTRNVVHSSGNQKEANSEAEIFYELIDLYKDDEKDKEL